MILLLLKTRTSHPKWVRLELPKIRQRGRGIDTSFRTLVFLTCVWIFCKNLINLGKRNCKIRTFIAPKYVDVKLKRALLYLIVLTFYSENWKILMLQSWNYFSQCHFFKTFTWTFRLLWRLTFGTLRLKYKQTLQMLQTKFQEKGRQSRMRCHYDQMHKKINFWTLLLFKIFERFWS